jgi:heme A synthase
VDSNYLVFLRWTSIGFFLLIFALVMLIPTDKRKNKTLMLLSFIQALIGMACIFIGLRANTWIDLLKPPVVEPFILTVISFICCFFIYRQVSKEDEPK